MSRGILRVFLMALLGQRNGRVRSAAGTTGPVVDFDSSTGGAGVASVQIVAGEEQVNLRAKLVDASGNEVPAASASWTADQPFVTFSDATALATKAIAGGQVGTTVVNVAAVDQKGQTWTASVTVEVVAPVPLVDHAEVEVGAVEPIGT